MADVCLLLEGTYPYVSGGVSACAHQLITMLDKTEFNLVYLGTNSSEILRPKYKLPPNVVGLQEIYLFDEVDGKVNRERSLSKDEADALHVLHANLHLVAKEGYGDFQPLSGTELRSAMKILFPYQEPGKNLFNALASFDFWELIVKEYTTMGIRIPFIEFFYTWRAAHIPIYRVLSQSYPKARLYHSLCTGYAGLAASCASVQHDAPVFITEHGIYAHERAIEISEASWFYKTPNISLVDEDPADAIKEWWINMFRNMSRISYSFASEIITLFEGNIIRQIKDGAPRSKTRVIPNGISLKFEGLRRQQPSWGKDSSRSKFRIGFIGRVVPIKDVKTLIKTIHAVYQSIPNIECQIIGPEEEDLDYYRQCNEMMEVLGLTKIIQFVGKKDVTQVYPHLDCVLLTSISEAQPLVVLEANLAGVPVVSTRVGCCAELLEGRAGADRLLGPSGLLAPIGDAERIAKQIITLISSPPLWEQMSLAGMARVKNFYEERELISRYERLYLQHISQVTPISEAYEEVVWRE